MKPVRLLILEALTETISAVNAANGFQTDLQPGSVFRGRSYFGKDDPLPMVALSEPPVMDSSENMEPPGGSSHRKGDWTIIVQGFVKDGDPHPCDPAYVFAAEVTKAIADAAARKKGRSPDPFGLGDVIEKVMIGSPVVRPSDNISATAYFWINLRFQIVEDLSSPMR